MRALIVDDSRYVRGYLRNLLEDKGFECEEAGDGPSALALVNAGPPFDLVLVDWIMPGMEGPEVLRQLRAGGFAARVMMVTTESEISSIVRALEAGADEYLMKPFDEEALTEKLALLGLVER